MAFEPSINNKVTSILVGMVCLTATMIAASYFSFRDVAGKFSEISEHRIPELLQVSNLVSSTGAMTRSVSLIEVALSSGELSKGYAAFEEAAKKAANEIAGLGADVEARLLPVLADTQAIVDHLNAATRQVYETHGRIAADIARLSELTDASARHLEATGHVLLERLEAGGATANESISTALDDFANRGIQGFAAIMSARADARLLSGMGIARTLTDNEADLNRLTSSGDEAAKGLEDLLPDLSAQGLSRDVLVAIQVFVDLYRSGVDLTATEAADYRGEYLAAGSKVDAMFETAMSDGLAAFKDQSVRVAVGNGSAFDSFLKNEVAQFQEIHRLQTELAAYGALAAQVALSPGGAALAANGQALQEAAKRLSAMAPVGGAAFNENLPELLSLSDPKSGIAVARRNELGAAKGVHSISRDVAGGINSISDLATAVRDQALAKVLDTEAAVDAKIGGALTRIVLLGLAMLAIVGLALYAARRTIVAPLVDLAAATERLSGGDMAPLKGFSDRSDEIGRMGRSLEVFRRNSMRVDELRREADAKDEAARAAQRAMFATLAKEIGVVVQDASNGDFTRRVVHVFDDHAVAELAANVNGLMDATENGLNGTRAALRALAGGDMTHRMDGNFRGVFADLRDDVNGSARQLADLIRGIREAADTSNTTAAALSDGAQELSARAVEQAATLERTAASMGEISTSMSASVTTLTKADMLSRQVGEKTRTGAEAADRAVESVSRIQDSSMKITEIISVLDAISFQTNLLALNAGVEAARAGDAGKGFAVVAQEVGILAQRSQTASGEIGKLIKETSRLIGVGVENVGATGTALKDIDATVKPLIGALDEVSRQGQVQAQDVSFINDAISNLDQMTQQNSVQAERTTNDAQELSRQIMNLRQVASSFRTDGATEGRSAPSFAA